ncbi:Fanconi anemia group D2 protein [Tripterygium wilfordii]|uniref:Fanconi anemia group D2 protein n=1 Tax=Tripterygium wilfordii TaxID=458696 RepID=A0A7J7CKR8_TRIWF|nr:Fanconi anemia group D2 protein [Tripterygium wilfordii]
MLLSGARASEGDKNNSDPVSWSKDGAIASKDSYGGLEGEVIEAVERLTNQGFLTGIDTLLGCPLFLPSSKSSWCS